jgi:hypothetical protein
MHIYFAGFKINHQCGVQFDGSCAATLATSKQHPHFYMHVLHWQQLFQT